MQIKKDDGDDDQLQTFGKPQQNIGVDQNINNSLIVNDQADIKENQINDNSNISNDFTLPIPTNTKFSLIKHGIPKQLHFLFSRYCSLCLQWADDAVVTPCQPQQHVFCRKCLHQYYEDAFEAKSTKITELKEKVINKLYGEGNGDEDEMDQQIGKKEKNKSNQQKKRGKNAKINKRIDEELIKAQEEMKILRCPVCGNQITKICGVSLKVLQCAHILASDVRGKKLLGLDPDGDEIDNEVEDEEDNNNKDKEKEKNTKLGNVIVKENKIIEKDNDNTKDNKIVKNDEETKPTTEIVKQKKTHIVREWITSTKMLSLAEYITNMPKGEKIVVFSQWTTCLDIIEGVMHHIGCKFCRFDGEQSFTVQQTNLKQFSSPKGNVRVLLASLKAGGVGLNLYAANHVILIDKWWNPFVEEQAIDRVHRIGQTKPVSVIRLKCIQSIEERIEALQEKKMIKAEDVLQDERNEFRDASIGDGDAEQDKMAAKLGKSLTLNDYGFLIGGRSLGRPSTFNSRQQRPQAAQQNVSIPSFNAYPYAVNIPQQRPSPQPLYNQNIPLNAQSDQMQFPSFNFY
ncbi:MAG: putative DNA repair protein [Streblomastix strix]|uniref:Putative DNA repair protein n=1 Tax=Streblomastix strix TaxID=222440 RepID=A0A5J4WMU0_9EUKA|nr:MAG: putative DNA repair protein [Streblomastix strix]